MDPALESVTLEVLGLPSEVVTLLLRRLDDTPAAMRLGLTNPILLTWIDSQYRYWTSVADESGLELLDVAAPPKKRVALGLQAIRNIENPNFNSVHIVHTVTAPSSIIHVDVGSSSGRVLATCDTSVDRPDQPLSMIHLDLLQWPQVKLTELKSDDSEPLPFLSYVGKYAVSDIVSDNDNDVYKIYTIDSPNISLTRIVDSIPLPNGIRPGVMKMVSTDPNFPRIWFCSESDDSFHICLYDIDTHTFGPVFISPALAAASKTFAGPSSFQFRGELFMANIGSLLCVVRFAPTTLEPKVLFEGHVPEQFSAPQANWLLTKSHLICSISQPDHTEENSSSSFSRVRLSEIERTSSISTEELILSMFKIPFAIFFELGAPIVVKGPLVVVPRGDSALILDFDQRRVIRKILNDGNPMIDGFIFQIVDSTMFVAWSPFRLLVVDMLARQEPAHSSADQEYLNEVFLFGN